MDARKRSKGEGPESLPPAFSGWSVVNGMPLEGRVDRDAAGKSYFYLHCSILRLCSFRLWFSPPSSRPATADRDDLFSVMKWTSGTTTSVSAVDANAPVIKAMA